MLQLRHMRSVSHFVDCSKDVLGGEPVFTLIADDSKTETLMTLMPKLLDILTKTPLPSGSPIKISA